MKLRVQLAAKITATLFILGIITLCCLFAYQTFTIRAAYRHNCEIDGHQNLNLSYQQGGDACVFTGSQWRSFPTNSLPEFFTFGALLGFFGIYGVWSGPRVTSATKETVKR